MYTDDDLYREHLKQRAAEADTTILPGMYVRWKAKYKPEKADWHVGQADLINMPVCFLRLVLGLPPDVHARKNGGVGFGCALL